MQSKMQADITIIIKTTTTKRMNYVFILRIDLLRFWLIGFFKMPFSHMPKAKTEMVFPRAHL